MLTALRAVFAGEVLRRGERGQILIMFVAMISLFFIAAAFATDYTMWLSERRGIARAADMAALAAIQDLPADPGGTDVSTEAGCDTDACTAVYDWAARNGYGEGDGAIVRVSFFCSNTIAFPPAGFCTNENRNDPTIPISPCGAPEVGCDSVRVSIEKPAANMFSSFFGGVDFDIGYSSFARVSFRIAPLDTVMSIDASGSMSDNCNATEDNPGCAIGEARIAANEFVTILLGDDPAEGNVQIGYAPYRGCYDPPSDEGNCVPSLDLTPSDCGNPPASSWVLCLGKDPDALRNRFAATDPNSSTNVCLGLYQSGEILDGPGKNANPEAQRFIVILTDGENSYQNANVLPPDCRPNAGGCGAGTPDSEARLDRCTSDVADDLKAADVEIYVIGLNVEGTDNGDVWDDPGFCNGIGNGNGDAVANRRLLKCIASSNAGSNDHYFETDDAITLGDIFQGVAYEIAGRGLSNEQQ